MNKEKTVSTNPIINTPELPPIGIEISNSAATSLGDLMNKKTVPTKPAKQKKKIMKKKVVKKNTKKKITQNSKKKAVKKKTVTKKKIAKRKTAKKPLKTKNKSTGMSKKAAPMSIKNWPISLLNLMLFTVIFTSVIAATISLRLSEKRENVSFVISPVEINSELEVDDIESSNNQMLTSDKKIKTVEKDLSKTTTEEIISNDTVSKEPVTTTNEKVESILSFEKQENNIKMQSNNIETVQSDISLPKKHIAKKTTQPKVKSYKDPYTSGGPLDLDRPQMRELYRATNKIYVPKKSASPSSNKYYNTKRLHKDFYKDINKQNYQNDYNNYYSTRHK